MSCLGTIGKTSMIVFGLYILGSVAGCFYQRAKYLNEPESRTYRDVPGATADFVKEQQAKNKRKNQASSSKVESPTGQFAVYFKAKEGANKRFIFDVQPRNNVGDIKVKIEERGDKNSVIGGDASFNVVFWDPAHTERPGLAFRIEAGSERGCSVYDYNDAYQTIYIAKGERITAQYNWDNTVSFAKERIDVSNAVDKRMYTKSLPQLNVPIENFIIQAHQRKPQPMELQFSSRSR